MEKERLFGLRAVAFFIDLIVVTIISILISFLVGINSLNDNVILFLIYTFTVFFLYFNKDLFNGTSLGKAIMKIKVVSLSNKKPSFFQLLFRNLFLILYPLEVICMLIRKDGRRFGDLITKTKVVIN
jgi:uncharacterized RDD family membrane protein YckC